MDSIDPGKFREKIRFLNLVRTSDGGGGSGATWDTYLETFAKVTPMKAITQVDNDQMTVFQPYNVVIHYAADREIKPDMRVVFRGVDYAIKNIMPVDVFKRYITFMIIAS